MICQGMKSDGKEHNLSSQECVYVLIVILACNEVNSASENSLGVSKNEVLIK
jgi:hypothetical protein